MSTDQLLQIIADRGLKLFLKDGQPVLRGARTPHKASEQLLAALALHRERIIAKLKEENN